MKLVENLETILVLFKDLEENKIYPLPTIQDQQVSEILFQAICKLKAHLEFESYAKNLESLMFRIKNFYRADNFLKIAYDEAGILLVGLTDIDTENYTKDGKKMILELQSKVMEFIKA